MLLLSVTTFGCNADARQAPALRAHLPPSTLVIGERERKLADFPCRRCHDHISTQDAADGRGSHRHRGLEFGHFEGINNCFICHDYDDRDHLRLLAGRKVGFNETHELCGQCHGEKFRDWRIGAHGKNVGGWIGIKNRLACTDCHDPHRPGQPTTEALDPPPFPRFGIPKKDVH